MRRYYITDEFRDIESCIIQNNYKVIDDINNREIYLKGIALLSDGSIVGLLDKLCYNLRVITIKNKIPHLSIEQLGLILVKGDIDRFNDECDNKIVYNFIF